MKILVTAATEAEIALSIKHIASLAKEVQPMVFEHGGHEIHFVATGVGMVPTAYKLTRLLAGHKYDFAIQAGIAGSFNRDIAAGEVVLVRADRFARLGAEDGDEFIDVFDMGLIPANDKPFSDKLLVNPLHTTQYSIMLPEVNALTVHTVTGSDATTENLLQQYNCDLESMEGAVFHYICLSEDLPFAQIRSVSNYVERRNRAAWRIDDALINLNKYLVTLLSTIPAL